ncbi:MAG: CBS domain-containing protein [Acidimicrobiia bacterium]|nr:CBS domain-containing protein [Acidimicrobiia bacterium]
MRARDIMTQAVLTVPSGTSADEAWQLMRTHRIHHLLVGGTARPMGIVSERDLGGRSGASVRRGCTVDDLMTRGVVSVAEDETIRKVANVMRGRSIGCVLVSQRRKIVGIITVSDLLELLGRGGEHPARTISRPPLHHRVPHRKQTRTTGVW